MILNSVQMYRDDLDDLEPRVTKSPLHIKGNFSI